MKVATTILLCGLLAGCGCATAYQDKGPPNKITNMDMGTFSQKVHFIELMEFVRDNAHKAPPVNAKSKVERLIFEAGLTQRCENKRCWLEIRGYRITTDTEFINIQMSQGQVVKIDIHEPERAAKVIYG